MIKRSIHITAVLVLVAGTAFSQSVLIFDEAVVTANLKKHITTLASDEYEGREAGTEGEAKAYRYISEAYKQIGLFPKGSEGYLQPFPFTSKGVLGEDNSLVVDGKKYKVEDDFYPIEFTAAATAEAKAVNVGFGISAPNHDDYEGRSSVDGKIVIMEYGYPASMHPHSKMAEYADHQTRVDSAVARGAVGVVFINSDEDTEDPKSRYTRKVASKEVPVLFATGKAHGTMSDIGEREVRISAEIIREKKTAYNVVGYIDNNAANTVVIGAHYDHLGYGDEGSLHRGKRAIHNGADDNASGVAVMIELARILDLSTLESNNYMFIGFSGEEKGLLGSNYFVKNPTYPLDKINYMMNMDMVGRLKEDTIAVLIVNGVGTSPEWQKALDKVAVDSLRFKTTESGIGPSDHTSFYLKDIPSVHFFSGTHGEYHKPGDDEELINYDGQIMVMKAMLTVIDELDKQGKIAFTKTDDSKNENVPRFKVTLGVVPDYAFDGEGMRIDGVTEGKPAHKAGMQAGDVVTGLGDVRITDMMSYMKGLSKFSKGDKTKVRFMRGEEAMEAEIQF